MEELNLIIQDFKETCSILAITHDSPCEESIKEKFEEYHQTKLKLLGIANVGVSFKTLLEKADSLYEQAKQAPSEREELILASKSIMCSNLANEALNER